MKIFLLGSNGFVGSGIAKFFTDQNIDFTGITRDNYDEYKGQQCDLFINAAGSSKKRLAAEDPVQDFQINVMSTMNTLQDFPCKKYIMLSTIDIYPDVVNPENNAETAEIDTSKISNYGLSKYMAEQLVKHYAKDWVILRLGGMVGPSLKKNSVYDVVHYKKTFVSPKSEYQYIPTTDVAKIIMELKDDSKEIYNLCGDGTIVIEDVFRIAGVEINKELYDLRQEKYDINIDKIKAKFSIPKTREAVEGFVKNEQSQQ